MSDIATIKPRRILRFVFDCRPSWRPFSKKQKPSPTKSPRISSRKSSNCAERWTSGWISSDATDTAMPIINAQLYRFRDHLCRRCSRIFIENRSNTASKINSKKCPLFITKFQNSPIGKYRASIKRQLKIKLKNRIKTKRRRFKPTRLTTPVLFCTLFCWIWLLRIKRSKINLNKKLTKKKGINKPILHHKKEEGVTNTFLSKGVTGNKTTSGRLPEHFRPYWPQRLLANTSIYLTVWSVYKLNAKNRCHLLYLLICCLHWIWTSFFEKIFYTCSKKEFETVVGIQKCKSTSKLPQKPGFRGGSGSRHQLDLCNKIAFQLFLFHNRSIFDAANGFWRSDGAVYFTFSAKNQQ